MQAYLSQYGTNEIALNKAMADVSAAGGGDVIIDVSATISNYLWAKNNVALKFNAGTVLTKAFNTVGDWSLFHLDSNAQHFSMTGGTIMAAAGITGKLVLLKGDYIDVNHMAFISQGGGFAETHVGNYHTSTDNVVMNDNGHFGDDGLHVAAGSHFYAARNVIHASDDAISVNAGAWQQAATPLTDMLFENIEAHSSLARAIAVGVHNPVNTGEVARIELRNITGSSGNAPHSPAIMIENQGYAGQVHSVTIRDSVIDASGANPHDVKILRMGGEYLLDNVSTTGGQNATALLQLGEDGVIENFTYNIDVASTVRGGTDDADVIYTASGGQIIASGRGADEVHAGSGADTVWGSFGNDTLYGDSGNDSLVGGYGNDVLYGGGSSDILFGGAGDDSLFGGAGTDTLYGGSGSDVFFAQKTDTLADFNNLEDTVFWL